MNETFMKEKPIFPLLLGMGMPMVLSMLVNSLYNIVDSYFVALDQRECHGSAVSGISDPEFHQCHGHWFRGGDQRSDRHSEEVPEKRMKRAGQRLRVLSCL